MSLDERYLEGITRRPNAVFFEVAQAMAWRITREGGPDPAAKITHGYRLATAHKPDANTLRQFVQAFARESTYFTKKPREAEAIAGGKNPALAAWTMVANALLNLDQTITRE